MTILVGTSGYNHEAWKGRFYPEDLSTKKMLGYYAGVFSTVEINYSFYRKPTEKLLAGWSKLVPAEFRFGLKAWQRITHQKRLRDCAELVSSFNDAARTLGPQLGPILYQLPPNLKFDIGLLRDFLNQLPRAVKAAFEFRSDSWHSEETSQALGDAGCAVCLADAEELTTPIVRPAPWGYLRLRRAGYDAAALSGWAEVARGFKKGAFVYFKHEDSAAGTAYAKQFVSLSR